MKALTLHEPYASLIAEGAKHYETRSWPAPKSLPPGSLLAIHAAAKQMSFAEDRPPEALWAAIGAAVGAEHDFPLGKVLVICRFLKCWPTEGADLTAKECLFGDWSPGRWAWELEVVEVFDPPIPATGRQGLWEWERPGEVARS